MSGIILASGLNVALHVEKGSREEEEPFEENKKMEVAHVEEVKHNLEIVIMGLARVSDLCLF